MRQSASNFGTLELLVVDNGSTDGTQRLAETVLAESPFPSRVLQEPRAGQMAAFQRGFHSTDADIVLLVDDDNILADGFVATLIDLFIAYPEVGLIGSHNIATFPKNMAEPPWFQSMAGKFACSPPPGFANPPRPVELAIIAGAGASFRRRVLQQALDDGYCFINDTTREGSLWMTGMDTELCHLFGALGWKFLYDPRLRLEHAMTPERLNWNYARRLARTIGTSVAGIDPFIRFGGENASNGHDRRATWQWQALAKLRRLGRHGVALRKLALRGKEGDLRVLEIEEDYGSFLRVMHERGSYTAHMDRTRAFLRRIGGRPTRSFSSI